MQDGFMGAGNLESRPLPRRPEMESSVCAADYPNDQRGERVVGRTRATKPQWRRAIPMPWVLHDVQDLAQDLMQD